MRPPTPLLDIESDGVRGGNVVAIGMFFPSVTIRRDALLRQPVKRTTDHVRHYAKRHGQDHRSRSRGRNQTVMPPD